MRTGVLILLLLSLVGWGLTRSSAPVVQPPFNVPAVPPDDPQMLPEPARSVSLPEVRVKQVPQAVKIDLHALAIRDGWAALSSGNPTLAVQELEAPAAAGEPAALFVLALAYQRLEKPGEALLLAHQAAASAPMEVGPWRLLGDLSYALDDLQGAVDAWQQAQTIDPDPKLEDALARARHDLTTREQFLFGETRHFRVRFEGPAEAYLAERVLDILEDAYSNVGLALGYYPDQMIEAVLYTKQTFYDVTRSPEWSSGLYDGRVRLPISGADQAPQTLRQVARHEYVHAALASLMGRTPLPTWLHEGLAMNLEGGNLAPWAHQVLAQYRQPVSLHALSQPFLGLGKRQADAAYARSYLLVASLIERFGMFQVEALLKALPHESFADMFLNVLGETPDAAYQRALADGGVR